MCTRSKKRRLVHAFQGHQPITELDLYLDYVLEHVFSHVYVQLKLPNEHEPASTTSTLIRALVSL